MGSWLCAELFGWRCSDIERVEKTLEEWSLRSVEQQFLKLLRENPQQDPVGLLYQCLADQANQILGEKVFSVFPNYLDTHIRCTDEQYVRKFLESDILPEERDIIETALKEAGLLVVDFSCFFAA